MLPRSPIAGRGLLHAVLLLGIVSLGIGGCGRRGQPEPPIDPSASPRRAAATEPASRAPNPSSAGGVAPPSTALATRPAAVVQDQPADEDSGEPDTGITVSPQPTPTSNKKARLYQVPKEPFILDPLL